MKKFLKGMLKIFGCAYYPCANNVLDTEMI